VLFSKYVKIVNIEIFSFCNRRCSYCPVSLVNDSDFVFMDDFDFRKVLDQCR